jgi:putative transposase
MPTGLSRRYGQGQLHFITCSCYRRLPLLGSGPARDSFVKILGETRERYRFELTGYVVMPEHIHLLVGEPSEGTPSIVMQVLKQRVSHTHNLSGGRTARLSRFWEDRFYDFNVWSRGKIADKLQYMHLNPVKRGLVQHPKEWRWSSFSFYSGEDEGLIRIDPAR